MFKFKSLRSGSSGNCLLLETKNSRILIDCGLGSQLACKLVFLENFGQNFNIDGVVVSHCHSDHINYSSLRMCLQHRIPVYIHEKCLPQMIEKHFNGYRFDDLIVVPFTDASFEIKDTVFEPIELRHEPLHPTFGFAVHAGNAKKRCKMIAATDFSAAPDLLDHLLDADLIFIESNHDLKLLKENPNYASRFHMPNPGSAQLLFDARLKSKKAPKAVMLGHLSEKRNRTDIALESVKNVFSAGDLKLDFPLLAAPRYQPSEFIHVG